MGIDVFIEVYTLVVSFGNDWGVAEVFFFQFVDSIGGD
jgi:hypothetical protein